MKSKVHKDYSSNVFINCPFDSEYKPVFEAIVFTIHFCGFIPRCALEENDGTAVRIEKIYRIIDECKFGIHDLSRAEADKTTGLARFNMPLELGIFLGAKRYSNNTHYNKEKRALVMDIEQYRYQKFISDIAGQDIQGHNNNIDLVIERVRDFLFSVSERTSIPSSKILIDTYTKFNRDNKIAICASMKLDHNNLKFIEFSIISKFYAEEIANSIE